MTGRYFMVAEIDVDTFERMTGDKLDCLQVAALGCDKNVYVAIDSAEEDHIDVCLDLFDVGGDA